MIHCAFRQRFVDISFKSNPAQNIVIRTQIGPRTKDHISYLQKCYMKHCDSDTHWTIY